MDPAALLFAFAICFLWVKGFQSTTGSIDIPGWLMEIQISVAPLDTCNLTTSPFSPAPLWGSESHFVSTASRDRTWFQDRDLDRPDGFGVFLRSPKPREKVVPSRKQAQMDFGVFLLVSLQTSTKNGTVN